MNNLICGKCQRPFQSFLSDQALCVDCWNGGFFKRLPSSDPAFAQSNATLHKASTLSLHILPLLQEQQNLLTDLRLREPALPRAGEILPPCNVANTAFQIQQEVVDRLNRMLQVKLSREQPRSKSDPLREETTLGPESQSNGLWKQGEQPLPE